MAIVAIEGGPFMRAGCNDGHQNSRACWLVGLPFFLEMATGEIDVG